MAEVLIQVCSSMYHIPIRIMCLFIVLIQGVVLDYYLVEHKNIIWYSWIVADIAIIFVFIVAFIISYRHLIVAKSACMENTPVQTGALPLGYFAWFVYTVLLASRVAIIFRDFAWKLKEEDFFGPNTLKITISMSAFVFLLLLLSHHDADIDSERKQKITEIAGTVVFDVLDSVDVLDIMFDKSAIDDFPVYMDTAIIIVACINLLLPTLPLMTLSQAHFGQKLVPKEIAMLHKMMIVFLVNMPLLTIRLILWHVLGKDISIFPVKNLIVIFLVFHDIYEKQREKVERHDRCKRDGIEDPGFNELQNLRTERLPSA